MIATQFEMYCSLRLLVNLIENIVRHYLTNKDARLSQWLDKNGHYDSIKKKTERAQF